jgi:hypothetical protein
MRKVALLPMVVALGVALVPAIADATFNCFGQSANLLFVHSGSSGQPFVESKRLRTVCGSCGITTPSTHPFWS